MTQWSTAGEPGGEWAWRYSKADGSIADDPSESGGFPSQGDAETWVGECWRELLDRGVDAVSLYQVDRLVYGPMNLHPVDES